MPFTPHPFQPGDDALTCEICPLPAKNGIHVDDGATILMPLDEGMTRTGRAHPDTSHVAAAAALPRLGTMRRAILAWIGKRGGMTDDELEVATGRTHQSVSAARNGLVRDGWLVSSTDPAGRPAVRLTRSGNAATVWYLTARAEDALL